MNGTGTDSTSPAVGCHEPKALPAPLAAQIADLPSGDRAAVARLVEAVGEDGLRRIVTTLSAKRRGRRSSDEHTMPLLRQMAALLRGNPGYTTRRAATAVAQSRDGKA